MRWQPPTSAYRTSPQVCAIVVSTGLKLSDPDVCFALRARLLHHRPSDRMALVGEGIAHALHGDVRRVIHLRAQTNDNQGVLRTSRFRTQAR